jgi:hypothetical protein
MAAGVIVATSFYSLPAGVVAAVVDPVSGQISKPVMGPVVGFKAPWAYLIEDTYAVEVIEFVQLKMISMRQPYWRN